MTEAAAPRVTRPRASFLDRVRGIRPSVPRSFAELVWAHFERQKELRGGTAEGATDQRYRRYVAEFEASHGRIVDVYWCSNFPSAVALVWQVRRFRRDRLSLVRVSDWATKDVPQVAAFLYECDSLAVRVGGVLRDTTCRVALQQLFGLESYLLGVVDSAKGCPGAREVVQMRTVFRRERARILAYYQEAAVRAAQISYFWGMLVGAAALVVLGIVAASILYGFGVKPDALEALFASYTAGAIGAIVSVLQRVSAGRFGIDHELGRRTLRRLGSLRPAVGAVFGMAVVFALDSQVFQITGPETHRMEFLTLFAFVAGFSERFAKDLLEDLAGRGKHAPTDGVPPAPVAEAEGPPASASEDAGFDAGPPERELPEDEGESAPAAQEEPPDETPEEPPERLQD